MAKTPLLKIAVPVPLYRTFDYAPPANTSAKEILPGTRVKVPFGRSQAIGVVMGLTSTSDIPAHKIRPVGQIIDQEPILDRGLAEMLAWAADYYHHPLGEVYEAALPALLRQGKRATVTAETYRAAVEQDSLDSLRKKAPKQAAVLSFVAEHPGVGLQEIHEEFTNPRPIIKALIDKGLLDSVAQARYQSASETWQVNPTDIRLNQNQDTAVQTVVESLGEFAVFLLHGVTGSGKTEVYLHCLKSVLESGQQALVLVPEISLTPQLIGRFEARFTGTLSVLHSKLTAAERLTAWQRARAGDAPIVLGTRSAIFAPLHNCGMIVVDEEHDQSFKQQEGFRYSARDLAVFRARQLKVPVILGSATPSLESMRNVDLQRYRLLSLPNRTGLAGQPSVSVIDLSHHPAETGLSPPLVTAMKTHLEAGNQVLLFLNRRGFAPVLFCTECGWIATCSRCDANMTVHLKDQMIRCHHCGQEHHQPVACPQCSQELKPVGQGTQRIEDALGAKFPDYPITRIDRDSTQRRGAMEAKLKDVASGKTRILLGTQMLTKGHDFGGVTLVGILDGDQGLFGTDFRSNERFAQTVIQVAGRAGRAERAGQVLVQTHFPNHPLLARLIKDGYAAFAEAALQERQVSGWPPFSANALLRASATRKGHVYEFLNHACDKARAYRSSGVMLLGPAAAPMEKRAGRYRGQVLIQAEQRGPLHRFLTPWIPALADDPASRRVRWSIDVDPAELI